MKYSLLLLTVAVIDFSLNINGLPVPVGQIIKYRVPSKYFNQPSSDGTSTTLSTAEGSNSLYDFLLHKHFGNEGEGKKDVTESDDSAIVTSTLSTMDISATSGEEEVNENEEAEEVFSTMQNMQDFSETSTSAISDEQQQEEENEMPTTSSTEAKDDFLPELIKKVVNEQLEKLVSENVAIESADHDNSQSDNDEQIATTTEDNVASAVADENPEDDNTTPSDDSLKDETTTAAHLEEEEEEDSVVHEEQEEAEADEVDKLLLPESDPLLGAVTDLLSSILGLQFEQKLLMSNDDVTEEQPMRTTTEKVIIDEPKVAEEEEAATTIKSTNEIDMMIENLASSVGFATEETPTFVESLDLLVTEKNEDAPKIEPIATTTTSSSSDEIQKDNLMELEKIAEEVEEMKQLATLRQRINQVMDLVKKSEEDLKFNSNKPESNVDDPMITKTRDDDDVVSGTLKELHSNLGINDESIYETIPSNTDKIKNIETTINESLINKNSHHDDQVFLPNSAKAALRYKYYDNHDF